MWFVCLQYVIRLLNDFLYVFRILFKSIGVPFLYVRNTFVRYDYFVCLDMWGDHAVYVPVDLANDPHAALTVLFDF